MVFRNTNFQIFELPEKPRRSVTTTNGFKNRAENIVDDDEEVNDKIYELLKQLTLRDKGNILIQFWSPSSVGKYDLLKTNDQPFGLDIHNQGLCDYKTDQSERNGFLVDEECKEEDFIPIVRVFRRQLPEWTSDVKNYHSEKHPLKDCATRWNPHGYLVLPVFDSITMSCVGVLELLTSSKYLDCAYEVQEVHRTLKEANLTSPQAFDSPTSYVEYQNRQHELDEIFKVLKEVCNTHKLPLAQTWTVSSKSSFVATEKNIEMTCSSFNARCIGKVCMSTTGLPFYVHDLHFWQFREACREHHLLKSEGVVGSALASQRSCFCADVTKLGEDEYSLVDNARMSGLTSCYAIYLRSSEHSGSYLLEFFLPVNMKDNSDLQNLVQMIKMQCKFSSVEFGDLLNTNMIGKPMEASQLSLTMHLTDTFRRSSSKEKMHLDSKDPHRVGETNAHIDYINAQYQCDFGQVSHNNWSSTITNREQMYADEVITSKTIDVGIGGKEFKSREKPAFMKQRRKHRTGSLTLESIHEYFELLQEDSGETQTTYKTNALDQHEFSKCYPKSRSSVIMNTEGMHVDDIGSKELDIVTGDKRVCAKLWRKRKMDSVTPDTIQKCYGKPIREASWRLGASWPMLHRNMKSSHFGVSAIVLLLIRVKRWICSSNCHGFSGMWWICGKHNAFVCESIPSTNTSPKSEAIFGPLYFSRLTKESDESIGMTTPFSFSEPSQSHFGVSPKKNNVVNVKDTSMVTVKATFKDDIIKFQFPLSSGVAGLKNQVAQRIKLETTRFRLKYRDEDGDLILISCDADIRNLMPFSTSLVSKNTIKLMVQITDM